MARIGWTLFASMLSLACGGGEDADSTANGGSAGAANGGTSSGGASGASGVGGAGGAGGTPILTCGGGSGGIPDGFHVATNGSPSGDGSAQNPWDLATALLHP